MGGKERRREKRKRSKGLILLGRGRRGNRASCWENGTLQRRNSYTPLLIRLGKFIAKEMGVIS